MKRTFKEKTIVIVYPKFYSTSFFAFDIKELSSGLRYSEVQNDSTKELWMFLTDIEVTFGGLFFNAVMHIIRVSS